MEEILTIKNIIIYVFGINLIAFLAMFIDKQKAKKGKWRIPEKTLFIITALGGGIGTLSELQGVVGTNDRHQHGRRRKDRRRSVRRGHGRR